MEEWGVLVEEHEKDEEEEEREEDEAFVDGGR